MLNSKVCRHGSRGLDGFGLDRDRRRDPVDGRGLHRDGLKVKRGLVSKDVPPVVCWGHEFALIGDRDPVDGPVPTLFIQIRACSVPQDGEPVLDVFDQDREGALVLELYRSDTSSPKPVRTWWDGDRGAQRLLLLDRGHDQRLDLERLFELDRVRDATNIRFDLDFVADPAG